MDLTLRLCKNCGVGDSIGLAIICESLLTPPLLQRVFKLHPPSFLPLLFSLPLSLPLTSLPPFPSHACTIPSFLSLTSSSGILVVVGSILVLIFNIGVPNDLKGFLFFAQVVGFVYQYGADRDSLSWVRSKREKMCRKGWEGELDSCSHFFLPFLSPCLQDFHLSRVLGFSVYLPICPFTTLPALWTAAFALLPCLLAILTVIVYIIW